MKKKTMLIVQGSLQAGGAEKAVVSLLNTIPKEQYDIDLMLFSREGLFSNQIPKWINIIDAPYPYNCLAHKPTDYNFFLRHNLFMWLKKIYRSYRAKHQKKIHLIQSLWKYWKHDIPMLQKQYDIAYGGQEGFCNYYIIDKVKANCKILWIHNDYEKIKYSDKFDQPYFQKATIIATMSSEAQIILQKHFPESADHIRCLENITNGDMIWKMSNEPITNPMFKHSDGINIISVGRLAPVKAFDRAIQAASILKQEQIKFQWTIIGEGPERTKLELLKQELNVNEEVSLLGLQSNPYKYILQADMMVVSSNFEGKSIAIDEAQILGKPVITTNYPTAKDAVLSGKTGIICNMSPEAIAESILLLYNDSTLYHNICQNLNSKKKGNVSEIIKYIEIFEKSTM